MRRAPLSIVLLSLLAPLAVQAQGATVTLKNSSDWAFHQLFLSPADDNAWGADQLGAHTVPSDGQFTLQGIPCDTYDVKLVDEDGDECTVSDVDLCANDNVWTVDNDDLLACQVLTAD